MSQAEFTLEAKPLSQCDCILRELENWRGQWVPMPRLYEVSGAFAVHSRIADLRKRGHNIEQRSTRLADGTVSSWYRLV